MVVTQARYGDRNFLIQLYFAWMIVCMTLVKNVILVLQISKQAKARVILNGKQVGSKNGIVFLSGTQILNTWVAVRHFSRDPSRQLHA